MSIKVGLIFCVISCCVTLSKQCSKQYPHEEYLATRTAYRVVSNWTFNPIHYEGCKAEKVWMLVRHGTRNPSVSDIQNIKTILPNIRSLILESKILPNDYIKNRDLDLFKKWKFRLDISDETKLTHEGEEEMLLLAERMQGRFPGIFDKVYSNTTYKLKFTHSQRTKKSAYYFAAGLFGKKTAKDVWFPEPMKNDPILRFYKLCQKWRNDIKASEKENGEYKKFSSGTEMSKVIENVNNRLGLDEKLDLSDVYIMYIICGFETAWNYKSKSPWCSVFTEDDLKVLEYNEDLKYYWIDGYGYPLTYKQACPAFGDMINHLDSENEFPKVTVYFTHSGTLLKMLAHMGLYKDEHALHANSFDKMSNRKWKTSKIDAFGTNLAFVSFNCGGNKKVLTLHQENIVRLPLCPHSDLCNLEEVMKYYNQSIESCDFNAMCRNSSY